MREVVIIEYEQEGWQELEGGKGLEGLIFQSEECQSYKALPGAKPTDRTVTSLIN